MPELRKTPLHALHRDRGAKMIDFAGWEMPLHYGSQIEEHHRVRRAAGMFDVSHMLAIDFSGAATGAFLRRLLANDIARLAAPGKALYSCMLNEAGGVIDDVIVYFLAAERYRMVVNAATAARDEAWIETWRTRVAAPIEVRSRRDLAIVAVQGPAARERVWQARPALRAAAEPLTPFAAVEVGDLMIARTGYTGEDGYEIMLPAAEAPDFWRALEIAGVTAAGLGARDTLRLEAGLNLYGEDMDEDVSPMECGLAWTVNLATERDFVGRSALTLHPVRHQLGLVVLDRGMVRGHQVVRTAAGEGVVTSGGFAPTLGCSIGLARVPTTVSAGASVEVEVRGKRLAAKTVTPPFVRHGKILIDVARSASKV